MKSALVITTTLRKAMIASSALLLLASCSLCSAFVISSNRHNAKPGTKHPSSLSDAAATATNSLLIPEQNPYANPHQVSSAGRSYGQVLQYIHSLFPPERLEERNAASRTDGYWPYIQAGDTPPQEFVYGEFDFYFFAQLMDRALPYYHHHNDNDDNNGDNTLSTTTTITTTRKDWSDKVFVDLGSGTGRLVLAAAALHPNLQTCKGIEVLPSLHEQAKQKLALSSREDAAPVEFVCGSFDDPYTYLGNADCIFVFSTAMPTEVTNSLANAIGRQCRPGTIVISTDYMLPLTGYCEACQQDDRIPSGPFELELVDTVDGYEWTTGGTSTGYIHRVVKSLWEPHQVPLQPKKAIV